MGRRFRRVIVLGLLPLLCVAASSQSAVNPPHRPVTHRTTPSHVEVRVRDSRFHWTDAGAGAAAMLAATFLALGVALAMRPDRRSHRGREAASSARRERS